MELVRSSAISLAVPPGAPAGVAPASSVLRVRATSAALAWRNSITSTAASELVSMRRMSETRRSTLPARSVISSELLPACGLSVACCGASGRSSCDISVAETYLSSTTRVTSASAPPPPLPRLPSCIAIASGTILIISPEATAA